MRRPQNLKQSDHPVFHSVVSKQEEDFFKVLWPFQKSWTLILGVVHKLRLQDEVGSWSKNVHFL